jgi:pentatricopeptide repeat protein
MEEMEAAGVKPNVKTYTTLIHGWANASLPEKALSCFEELKLAGLKPDKAVYHCLMTSLLSRATVAEAYIYSGILSICREMLEFELTVDMGTAVYWSKCLRKIERIGGELTQTLQKTFPPDWNAHHSLEANHESDINDEPSIHGDNDMFLAGVNDGDGDDEDDDHHDSKGFNQRLWV